MFARRMNRRIERASEGQRRSLEYNIRGYTTRQRSSGITVFSQAKAKTEQEYYKRMKELKAFEQAKTSTRAGWKRLKRSNVEKAAQTFRDDGGYDITDDELEIILEELEAQELSKGKRNRIGTPPALMEAITNVEIAKSQLGDSWEETIDNIRSAINQKRSDFQRTKMLLELRKRKKNARSKL